MRFVQYPGSSVSHPDLFVVRFAQDLEAEGVRRVLDAGCGSGRNSAYLASLGFEVVALDSAADKVREARGGVPLDIDVSFLVGRLESLPFSSQSIEAVVCSYVVEYLDAPRIREALAEFRRVLKRGGLLLLTSAAKEGADVEGAENLGENRYCFKRGDISVAIHLADREELEGWLHGYRIREMLRLSLEYPRAATISANWAVVASA